MSENELKVNAECYLDAVEAIDEIVKQFELDVYEMIREWSNDPVHSHEVKKLSPIGKCCPMWMTYFRAHRSMMTSEILGFFKFLHLRTGMVETVVEGEEGEEGGTQGVETKGTDEGGIEMMTNPMGRPLEKRNASRRTVLVRQHHTDKVKELTQKISMHLVLNRDIDQEGQFLDDGDVSNEDSDDEALVVGGEGLQDSQVF
jgi:hypothetical protein